MHHNLDHQNLNRQFLLHGFTKIVRIRNGQQDHYIIAQKVNGRTRGRHVSQHENCQTATFYGIIKAKPHHLSGDFIQSCIKKIAVSNDQQAVQQ
jgi:hypothetical protein